MASDQARAVAEIQAALIIAASRPRNEFRAREKLLLACQRVNLASGALYNFPRGTSFVTGPSIRLAEAAANSWGNINYGFRELFRRPGESECEAFAWDLETNTKAVRQFSVKHRRDTKTGGYDLKDERDIYEMMANQAQRRVRAVILEIIPGDVIEDAVNECEKTMKAKVGDIGAAIERMLSAFASFGVSREVIEKRLGHRIDAIQPAQILSYGKIYNSLKDGMSEPKDWFDVEAPAKSDDKAAAPSPPKGPGRRPRTDAAAENKAPETPPAEPPKNEEPPQDPPADASAGSVPGITKPTLDALNKELARLGMSDGYLPPYLAERHGTGDPSELSEAAGQEALTALQSVA
jgi:hypothetical protein